MKISTFPIVITASLMLWAIPGISHAGISANGLIAYYDFNSDTAADTSDALGGSASANDGSWTGNSVYKDGAFGRAVEVYTDRRCSAGAEPESNVARAAGSPGTRAGG